MQRKALLARIERAEQAAKADQRFFAECICFPQDEPPFFAFDIELQMLTRVKCPLHGERFTPRFHIYVARWLRAKQPQLIWTHHSEQYRKAWFASFPPDLWPAEEEEDPSGRIFLKLKDGTRLLASEPTWTRKS
jgi:hypothetical protein